MPLETSIDVEKQQNHQPTSPLPIWEGRGIGQTDTPINRHNQGEVPYDASAG